MKNALLALALGLLTTTATWSAVTNQTVVYQDGETTLEGQLVWDDARTTPLPGILMFHQWGGWGEYELMRARGLAGDGYAVFVADVYGQGIRPATQQERVAEVTKYRGNRPLMRSRARAALAAFRAQSVAVGKIAAIGYCFGGTVALELARDRAPVDAVVSLHGGLATDHPAAAGSLAGLPVLILHGGDDPYVPDDELAGCRNEMRQAKAAWQIVELGGAVHAFTDPGAGNNPEAGAAYDESACRTALRIQDAFLAEHVKP
jgi:dienelactone hydrolase